MRASPSPTPGRPPTAAFAALVVAIEALIVLGALVRANDAGLACPDWPLCFGELIPRFDVKVAFEYAHRVLAGSLSLAFAWLAWRVWRRDELRARCGNQVALAAVLLVVQIVLGGLTVLQLLAAWTVTSHLLTGNAFAAVLLWITLSLRELERGEPTPALAPRGARASVGVTTALLALQMLLGGLVASRYAGLACASWPACSPDAFFPSLEGAVGLHLMHRWNALLLLAASVWAWRACRGSRAIAPWTALGLGLCAAQFGVGVANVLLELPVEVTGLHSALAAALVLTWTGAVRAAGVLGASRAPAEA